VLQIICYKLFALFTLFSNVNTTFQLVSSKHRNVDVVICR